MVQSMLMSEMTQTQVNREAKDILARLLATENLTVEHQAVHTAMFDTESRTLILPIWKDMSNDLYDMLVMHEVGHALFTPAGMESLLNALNSIDPDNHGIVKQYLNCCEDARIEKLMKNRFPGGRRNFYTAYTELVESDFFGIAGKDVAVLPFIDRINLHFKIGFSAEIPFTDEEQVLVDAVGAADTWEETLAATKAVYEYAVEHEPNQDPQEEDGEDSADFDDNPFESADGGQQVGSGGESDEEGDGTGSGGQNEESESEEGEDGGSGTPQGGDDSGQSMTDDTDDGESAESQQRQSSASSSGGEDNGSSDPDGNPAPSSSQTQQQMEQSLQDLVDRDASPRVYGELPKLNTDAIIISSQQVLKDFRECEYVARQRGEMRTAYKMFSRQANKIVNTMAKQFEMKKAADVSKRVKISKTGTIDTLKMMEYRWSEDIFRRNMTVTEGKNHGMVMFVDWSGSMDGRMGDTLRQLAHLAMFCKKVRIPFEVYAFTNSYGNRYEENSTPYATPENGQFHVRNNFNLLNIISSSLKNREFTEQMENLMMLIDAFEVRRSRSSMGTWMSSPTFPRGYSLGSTPLDESIVAACQIVPEFKQRNGLQIVHCTWLTDGQTSTSPIDGYRANIEGNEQEYGFIPVLRHRGSKKTWEVNRRDTTEILLEYFQVATGCSAIGFFVCSHRDAYYVPGMQNDYDLIEQFKQDKSLALGAVGGYSEFFVLDPTARKFKGVDDLNDNASATVLRNAFIKEAKAAKNQQNILNQFAEAVAQD
jgi:hypothetical protein